MNETKISRPAVTMYSWTCYMTTIGTALLLAPTWLFEYFALKNPGEGMWVRLTGMFFLTLAFYCYQAAKSNNREFMRWTAISRTTPIMFVTIFTALGLENPIVIVFGVIDVFAAYWTYQSLRDSEPKAISKSPLINSVNVQRS